jgi:hypothetical protein
MAIPVLPSPSRHLISEAQTVIYRRWREFGASHDTALDHAARFALRVASIMARTATDQPTTLRKPPMSERLGRLESTNYDLYLSLSEKAAIEENQRASEAFAAALNRQIKRGRESVARGTFVDPSPAIGARRLYGSTPASACGSPAAMCAERGSISVVAAALK